MYTYCIVCVREHFTNNTDHWLNFNPTTSQTVLIYLAHWVRISFIKVSTWSGIHADMHCSNFAYLKFMFVNKYIIDIKISDVKRNHKNFTQFLGTDLTSKYIKCCERIDYHILIYRIYIFYTIFMQNKPLSQGVTQNFP